MLFEVALVLVVEAGGGGSGALQWQLARGCPHRNRWCIVGVKIGAVRVTVGVPAGVTVGVPSTAQR